MALFVIGDTHLSLSSDKTMDIFSGWDNYVQRLEKNWLAMVKAEDTVVIPGDISWGMSLEECRADFDFLNRLPGEKILLKGNHDYWWTTMTKMNRFFDENGWSTLHILFNSSFSYGEYALCGTRGWIFEQGEPHDQKMVLREACRLRTSLEDADRRYPEKTKLVFLHYPPVYANETCPEILSVLKEYQIKQCYYGHIHSAGCRYALNGTYDGVEYRLISSDYLKFSPYRIVGDKA